TIADVTTNDEEGRIEGLEVLLRYPPGSRFFGWVAYSLSKSERKDPNSIAECNNLKGQGVQCNGYFVSDFDQTHVLTVLGSYKIAADFSAGFRFRYATGNPVTPVNGAIYDSDIDFYIPFSGANNSDRLP